MSYQQELSQFILHGNQSNLSSLFQGEADASIACLYRNGFLRSCREALASTFPSAKSFVGDDFFNALARAFIQSYPPADVGTLTGYGSQFPAWLIAQDVDKNPLLSQLAGLDWAWLTCLHGEDAMPLTAESFQHLIAQGDGAGELPGISLIENTRLMVSNEEATFFWLNLKEGVTAEGLSFSGSNQTQVVVFWRPELEVFVRPLPADEASYLEEILSCENINEASENVLKKHPSFNLPEQFSGLLQNGLLSIKEGSHNV